MKIQTILFAIITSVTLLSCEKECLPPVDNTLVADNKVEIRGNDTWLVSDRLYTGTQNDNQLNLVGGGTIYFSISVNTGKKVDLDLYLSIEDPSITGSNKIISKTPQPNPTFSWDPLKKVMDIHYSFNVGNVTAGKRYIGHVVINGPSINFHSQTDYVVYK